MKVYMEITQDKYELPVKVADSARELGMMCGKTKNTILSCISKSRQGKIVKSRYISVEIDEEEEE